MKTVFSNSMCAHVWAQRSQPEGRSDSMRFYGDVLYSYQTPIAAFTPEGIALITSHSYSNTTNGKHIPEARRAVRGKSFTVPDIGYGDGRAHTVRNEYRDGKGWPEVHENNLAWLMEQYTDRVARLSRVQSWTWSGQSDVLESLRDVAQTCRDYAKAFGMAAPVLTEIVDSDAIWKRCERLTAERNKPGADAKREKAREQREVARERREEKARAEKRAAVEKSVADWLAGVPYTFLHGYTDANGSALLRVRNGEVQTSRGASVPLADARHIWRGIKTMRSNGMTTWERPEGLALGYNLGHFTLDSFDEKGIRAGCHFISWSEIERIAPQLEVTP